ncbi:MAG: hypothetical protein CM1200mP39_05130 [Dehalococcoidia bacterium]|nr:MAG: hypothetical protein CM1200mP39_05130 [Dehalococcoidia bacterium]
MTINITYNIQAFNPVVIAKSSFLNYRQRALMASAKSRAFLEIPMSVATTTGSSKSLSTKYSTSFGIAVSSSPVPEKILELDQREIHHHYPLCTCCFK